MSNPTTPISDELYAYLLTLTPAEAPALRGLREESAKLPNSNWSSAPEQLGFLRVLVRLTRARRVLDLGTFTGLSALALALAMPDDGKVVTCDIASGWSEMGTYYWRDAGVENRIDRRTARVDELMTELIAGDGRASFDMIVLDADKRQTPTYIDPCADLLRRGGLLVADGIFRRGRVIDQADDDPSVTGMRQFSAKLRDDPRFEVVTIPVADGMTLACKK